MRIGAFLVHCNGFGTSFCVEQLYGNLLFVTAEHVLYTNNNVVPCTINILGKEHTAKIVHRNHDKDIALLKVEFNNNKEIPMIKITSVLPHAITISMDVWIVGFQNLCLSSNASILQMNVLNEVSNNEVCTAIITNNTDEYARWTTSKFCLMDQVVAYGFSGAPAFNQYGDCIAMICASAFEGVSWALSGVFIVGEIEVYKKKIAAKRLNNKKRKNLKRTEYKKASKSLKRKI
jgi:hypothetical protein